MSEEQAEVQETTEEAPQVVTKSTRSKIDNLEDALREIDKLRDENASKRVMNKAKEQEMREAAEKWQQHLESQKTELQKLQEKNAALEALVAEEQRVKTQLKLAAEFKLDSDLVEFIDGSDEDEMRTKAEKLSALKTQQQKPLDLHAGQRGEPVREKHTSGGALLLRLADEAQ